MTELEPFVTVAEVAKFLKKSRMTVYRWTEEGMPAHPVGPRSTLYLLSEVHEWIRSRTMAKDRTGTTVR